MDDDDVVCLALFSFEAELAELSSALFARDLFLLLSSAPSAVLSCCAVCAAAAAPGGGTACGAAYG